VTHKLFAFRNTFRKFTVSQQQLHFMIFNPNNLVIGRLW